MRQIFVLFGEWIVTFTFNYLLFQIHFPTYSLSHSLSHLNIIYSFIIYSFLIIIHFSTFFYSIPYYYNRKKIFEEWIVAHQTWWATLHEQKKTSFKETVGALFSSFFRFYTLYFGYICYVRDALTQEMVRREQIKLAKRWAQGSLTWLNFIPVGLNNGTCIDTGKHKLDNKTLDPKNKIIEKIIYIYIYIMKTSASKLWSTNQLHSYQSLLWTHTFTFTDGHTGLLNLQTKLESFLLSAREEA